MVKDPVCGMDVNEGQIESISEYKGKKYYFCNSMCKENFDKNPQQFI